MLNLHLKSGVIVYQIYKDMTLYPYMYQNVYGNLLQKKLQYIGMVYINVCNSRNIVSVSLCLVPFYTPIPHRPLIHESPRIDFLSIQGDS